MLSSYFLSRQLRQAEDSLREIQAIRWESENRTREAQAIIQEAENRRERAQAQLFQYQTRRAEAAEAQVKILQAQLDLNRKSRRYRRNRLRAAQQRRLCCTNCAKSL